VNKDEFVEAFYAVFERALFWSYKARREGLLALEEAFDNGKVDNRDVLEYGMRFVVNGTDVSIVDKVLSNIVGQEKDEYQALLKTIQKEAVLAMREVMNPYLFVALLNSYTDIPLNDPVFMKICDDCFKD
jgi:flagellar motor component MotA